MSILKVFPQTEPLRGNITVPGDKSISHRAVMLAALADGTSTIRKWLPAGDTQATLEAVQAMGVEVSITSAETQGWDLQISGRGLHGLQPPASSLDLRNAGTGIRLLAGIMVGQRFASILDGSEQLRTRPMGRIVKPLQAMGAAIESKDGSAPLRIRPASLRQIRYEMPVASAQVKSAVLLAGLYAAGETCLCQPGPARDHTERMLTAMGIPVTVDGNWICLPAVENERTLAPLDITVPADISSAAFPLIAAATVPHSEITIQNVGLNETRTGILELLSGMGAQYHIAERRETGGEPVGNIHMRFDELHQSDVGGEVVVRAIDEFPIWSVAATQAAGKSTLRDAAELRVKEVDRIARLAGELRRMGIDVVEHEDGFTVQGPLRLKGAVVDSHGDHRLGMSLAVAGLLADSPTFVRDADCIADSFPGFVETMRQLGAEMEWVAA